MSIPTLRRPPGASEPVPVVPGASAAPGPHQRLAVAGVAVAVVAGVAFRFVTRSDLWLDEALTVNIASVPLRDLGDALRRDGAPPLYYLLLHGWIALFGAGDLAARALSGLFSVAALPFAYLAGRRIGGRAVGYAAVVLLALSPFAIRFATEARMYSLVQLLVLLGLLAVLAALERPSAGRLAAVAVVAGLLALTQYWSFYLLAAAGLGFVALAVLRPARRRAALTVLGAECAGGVLFLPWLGSFLYQSAHTGTPWGTPAQVLDALMTSLTDYGGGPVALSRLLGIGLAALVVLALCGRPSGPWQVDLDLRTRPGIRWLAVLVALTMSIALAAGWLTDSAFATRYTSIVFPLFLLTAAYGIRALAGTSGRAVALAVVASLGLYGAFDNAVTNRTQAAQVAAVLRSGARPGDVIAYCPDQLGPDGARLAPAGIRQVTFPRFGDPRFVDWVDYASKQRVDPDRFANRLISMAGPGHAVWLVWAPGYRTLGTRCERINGALLLLRPRTQVVLQRGRFFESAFVTKSPPT